MLRWTRDVHRRMFEVMAAELKLSAQQRVPARLEIKIAVRKAARSADQWLLRRLQPASLRRAVLFCQHWFEWMFVLLVFHAVWSCIL